MYWNKLEKYKLFKYYEYVFFVLKVGTLQQVLFLLLFI